MQLAIYKVKCVVITQVDTILKTEEKTTASLTDVCKLMYFHSISTLQQFSCNSIKGLVVRLSWLGGRTLAAQARGVMGLTPGGCRPFYFHLITSKFIYFQHEARCSEHDYPCITIENVLTMHNITCFQYVKHMFHKIGTHCFLSWCYVY